MNLSFISDFFFYYYLYKLILKKENFLNVYCLRIKKYFWYKSGLK
jgi:hypothetical protein